MLTLGVRAGFGAALARASWRQQVHSACTTRVLTCPRTVSAVVPRTALFASSLTHARHHLPAAAFSSTSNAAKDEPKADSSNASSSGASSDSGSSSANAEPPAPSSGDARQKPIWERYPAIIGFTGGALVSLGWRMYKQYRDAEEEREEAANETDPAVISVPALREMLRTVDHPVLVMLSKRKCEYCQKHIPYFNAFVQQLPASYRLEIKKVTVNVDTWAEFEELAGLKIVGAPAYILFHERSKHRAKHSQQQQQAQPASHSAASTDKAHDAGTAGAVPGIGAVEYEFWNDESLSGREDLPAGMLRFVRSQIAVPEDVSAGAAAGGDSEAAAAAAAAQAQQHVSHASQHGTR